MKRTVLSLFTVLAGAPAIAHPGSAGEHELLSSVVHLSLTALPFVVVIAVLGLVALAFRRRT